MWLRNTDVNRLNRKEGKEGFRMSNWKGSVMALRALSRGDLGSWE